MNKSLLLQYIKGHTTEDQNKKVLDWIAESADNERYFLMLNNLWISLNISEEKATEEELREIRALTTQKRYLLSPFRKILPYAAAAVILLSLGLNFYLVKNSSLNSSASTEAPVRLADMTAGLKHELYTEKGVKARIMLPDSSFVWLNSDSKIVFPDRFESDIREIEFSGEAFFDIRKDSLHPLIIKTNKNFIVEVLGTRFNLKSYDNDFEARTTLYAGKLNVISQVESKNKNKPGRVVTTLHPLESCIIRNNQAPVHSKPDNVGDYTAWKDGKIIFDSTPISEAVKILERWHGVQFVVKDRSVYNYTITAKFKTESIVQIMEMIKYCALVDYSIDSTKVTLFGRKI
ncbi:MAG: DUF4974 domain-containing protein [Bacteroidales bacterium]|nr:DUF4974 domain-containing protein [Bacteroidales bacterium]